LLAPDALGPGSFTTSCCRIAKFLVARHRLCGAARYLGMLASVIGDWAGRRHFEALAMNERLEAWRGSRSI
jgi:hypothetical protein